MQEKLLRRIRTTNTWVLVGTASVIAVILANGMNGLFSLWTGLRLTPWAILFGSIDAFVIPIIIGPVVLNLYRRSASLQERNQALVEEMSQIGLAEQAAKNRASNLEILNELAVECADSSAETDLPQRITEKIQQITGALAVSLSIYSPQRQALIVEQFISPGLPLSAIKQILERNVIGLASPVSPAMLAHILAEPVLTTQDLTEVTFGAISPAAAALIRSTFHVGSYTVIAFITGSELWGTVMLVARAGQPAIEMEVAKTISHIVAVALRRRSVEDQLRKREARLRLITDNMVDMIIQVDGGLGLVFISPSVKRFLGFEEDDLAGQPLADFVHPRDMLLLQEAINGALSRQVPAVRIEFRLRGADGEYVWTESEVRLLYGSGSTFRGAVFGSRNIADRKKIEQDRQRLVTEMEAKNRELEQFTYTVSHDLRSPLVTIQGFLSFIKKDLEAGRADRVQKDILRISDATNRMQRLLEELLELSRIGRLVNPPQAVPFEEIVREAVEIVQGQIQARGVRVEIAGGLPTVFGDRVRLIQVMQNLLDNAVKFMGSQPQPLIEIGECGSAPGGQMIFFVRDNGIGIEPQHQEQIFGLFNKLSASTSGTGIGLALVKRIIEVHGGQVWAESQGIEKGTTFFFTIGRVVATDLQR